jgi:pathogenesis-related protein 1
MHMKMVLILLVVVCQLSLHGQTVPAVTGSKASQSDAQAALDFHNKVRKDVGSPPLEWSPELAAYAQEWADNLARNDCKMEHRPTEGKWKRIYGENIFWGSGAAYSPEDASKSWYSEIKDYKHEKLNSTNWYAAGHYTQMVWRNTKSVGIAIAQCSGGAVIIVGNYNPPGNYMGEKAY